VEYRPVRTRANLPSTSERLNRKRNGHACREEPECPAGRPWPASAFSSWLEVTHEVGTSSASGRVRGLRGELEEHASSRLRLHQRLKTVRLRPST
jgi:hypothetical protein